jgi:hypothetical protein
MDEYSNLLDIVDKFRFHKGDYVGAEKQLSVFTENYSKLSANKAELLRKRFDAKDRLGWLRIASTLFTKSFSDADPFRKEKLCKIFFALYSFENLEFGFDGVMDIDAVSDQLKDSSEIAIKCWAQFEALTSNDIARKNLENRIFSS